MTDPVSGGGAISDEDVEFALDTARIAMQMVFDDETSEEYFAGACEDALPLLPRVRARLDASEARAEAAERQRDTLREWYQRASADGNRYALELGKARAVVEAARDTMEADSGDYDDYPDWTPLRDALAALDAQPQPTPSPKGLKISEPVSGGGADRKSGANALTGMCPHCGGEVEVHDGLTEGHNWGDSASVCPGSWQYPRCAVADARPLWTGQPNERFRG